MDARPPPEVTIEGGPGWQLDGPREALGPEDDEPAQRPGGSWLERHRVVALVLAGAVGFVAATALSEARLTTLEESAEGALSLDVSLEQTDYGGQLVADADGRPALGTTFVVRNTGPRPVAFEQADLVGTPYRSGDLAGRRVADGGQTMVTLLRPVDCDDLSRTRAPGPLRVEATTGAGRRTVELRVNTEVLRFHDEQARATCGQAPPEQALVLQEERLVLDGPTLVVDVSFANASALPLQLESLTPARGLRMTAVAADGSPLVLPLNLPPGDFDPPVEPYEGRGPDVAIDVRLDVEDCARFAPPTNDDFQPAVRVGTGGVQTFNGFGNDPDLLRRLQRAACGDAAAPAPTVAPASSQERAQQVEDAAERRYFALRRDHPFLTPD